MQASLYRFEFWTQSLLYSSGNRNQQKIRTICHYWAYKKQRKNFSSSKVEDKEMHWVPPTLHNPPTQVSIYMPNSHFNCKSEVTPDNKALLFHSQGTLVPKVISANLLQLLLILSAHTFLCRDRCYSKLLLPLLGWLLRRRELCLCNYHRKFVCNLHQSFP